MQTGRGIPSPFLQPKTNIGTGEDLQAQADRLAKEKLQKNIESKPLEGSKDTRTETATVTAVEKGKKVERFAKTPAEIAAWKAAPQENKEKYIDKTLTATGTASDTGADKPTEVPTEGPKNEPKKYGTFWKQGTMTYLGTPSTSSGFSTEGYQGQGDIANMEKKQLWDTSEVEGDLSHNRGLNRSKYNTFEKYEVTPEDDLIMRYGEATKRFSANIISPYDVAWKDREYTTPGAGAAKRTAFMANNLIKAKEWEKKEAEKAANAIKTQELKKQKQLEWEKNKPKPASKTSATTVAPVAMQLKNNSKPMKNQMKNAAPKQMRPSSPAKQKQLAGKEPKSSGPQKTAKQIKEEEMAAKKAEFEKFQKSQEPKGDRKTLNSKEPATRQMKPKSSAAKMKKC
jgi:hypothetical protein